MKIIPIHNVDSFTSKLLSKPTQKNQKIVEEIINNVKKNGDSAVRKYEKKFSSANINQLKISKKEIQNAYSQVSKDQITSIKLSKKRLEKTESAIKNSLKKITLNNNGIRITKKFSAIESVGCYIPGGLAKYPSSVVMSVVPAKIAGVKTIILVSPPDVKGNIDPLILVTADICGVSEIFKTGGAQAIAAMAYGTKSIPKVDKIVGPGGSFVTMAKSLVSKTTSIDMVAGPTELGIIADKFADPNYIAADLISQSEHSVDTCCFLITTSKKLGEKVNAILRKKIKKVKRDKIIQNSLKKNGFIALCNTQKEMIQLANKLAPEHLQILTKNPQNLSNKIIGAGLVLLGEDTPSSASDYLFGSNHILPTTRFGRVRGSLSVLDFVKLVTQVKASKSSLQKLSKSLKIITEAEGLPNHYEAVRIRLE